MRIRIALASLVAAVLLSSCATQRKLTYMQDLVVGDLYPVQPVEELVVHPGDRLSIMIYATRAELAVPFNVMTGSFSVSSENGELVTSVDAPEESRGYMVDNKGDIELPFLGTLHVIDLTIDEVKELISKTIIENGYIQEPIVTVSLTNFKVIAFGELGPSMLSAEDGRLNLLEAVVRAGDLSLAANRGRLLVIRTEGMVRKAYEVNLYSMELFNSPVFTLQQGDIIYATPRKSKLDADSDLALRLLSVLLSTVSAIASICWWIFR